MARALWLRLRFNPVAEKIHRNKWGLVVATVFALLAVSLYFTTPSARFPSSDGFYSWIYARSLAFDGDIDFTNDYKLCGDPANLQSDVRGTHHPDNIFYPGPALIWTPALLVLRLIFPASITEASSCGPPWTTNVFALTPLFASGLVFLCYRFARRWFDDGVAALATSVLVFTGSLLRFSAVLPGFSHVYDGFFACVLLCGVQWASERPERISRWSLVSLALAATIFQRASNADFTLIPVCVAVFRVRPRARLALVLMVLAAGCCLGTTPFLIIYKYLYNGYFVFTHGRYFMHPAQAHPFLLLFDQEEGLFFFNPACWLAVLGVIPAIASRRTRIIVVPFAIVALVELMVASSPLDWSCARRLTNLLPLFILCAAFVIDWVRRWLEAKPSRVLACLGLAAAAPFFVQGLGYGYGVGGRVGVNRPLNQEELYGASSASFWRQLDSSVGPIAVLPAAIAFHLRYGLPVNSFGEAVYSRWYQRDFRTLDWGNKILAFKDPILRSLARNVTATTDGVHPTKSRATIVWSPEWPFATDAVVNVKANYPNRLRIGIGHAFDHVTWFGEAVSILGDGQAHDYEFHVPPGTFDNGIQEFVFDLDPHDLESVELLELRLDDRAPRPPAFDVVQ